MFQFGFESKQRISGVHRVLQELAYNAIKISTVDFGVPLHGGVRSAEVQKELYDHNYSKSDGTIRKSYHQSGLAIDFVPYIDGAYTWQDRNAFLSIAQAVFDAWEEIPDKQGFFLHWGGFWGAVDLNDNGLLDIDDKLGWDLPHFELRNTPQARVIYPITQL